MYNSGVALYKQTQQWRTMVKGFHITSLETRWQFESVWDGYFEILIYKEKTADTLENTMDTCNNNVKKDLSTSYVCYPDTTQCSNKR